jgi:hypothetical protein
LNPPPDSGRSRSRRGARAPKTCRSASGRETCQTASAPEAAGPLLAQSARQQSALIAAVQSDQDDARKRPFVHRSGERLLPPQLQSSAVCRINRVMKVFAPLRRFLDWDLSRGPSVGIGNLSILLIIIPWVVLLPFRNSMDEATEALALTAASITTAIWLAYVAWRGWRLIRASGVRGDRAYDRRDKLYLSSDYAKSESATKARRRRQNGS